MTKKNLFLILFTLALAGVYIVYFSDWFRPAGVQIEYTIRPPRQRPGDARLQAVLKASAPITFIFHPALKLTRVQVFAVAELETNRYALPVWHVVSDSNSPPTKYLTYGMPFRGLRPANKGQFPQPLVPGANYRLFVEAGDLKGQRDFEAKPKLAGP